MAGTTCDSSVMPGGEGAIKYTTEMDDGVSVMLTCASGHILSNGKSFQMVHCKHGLWNTKTVPDCVGKNIVRIIVRSSIYLI